MIISRNEIIGPKLVGPRIKKEWLDWAFWSTTYPPAGHRTLQENWDLASIDKNSVESIERIREAFAMSKGSVVNFF
jgi:hypothetical protein